MAGILFVLPGFLAILGLSYIYAAFGNVTVVGGLFFGLKAAVLAVVVHAVFRIGGRALNNRLMIYISAAACVAIFFFFRVPFPLIILAAGIIGYIWGRSGSPLFRVGGGHKTGSGPILRDEDPLLGEETPAPCQTEPLLVLACVGGVLRDLARTITAADSLPRRGQCLHTNRRVLQPNGGRHLWRCLRRARLCRPRGGPALRLAETRRDARRPRHGRDYTRAADHGRAVRRLHGSLSRSGIAEPDEAATLAAILTTWVTFVPCFLWIFLGAPFIERLRNNVALTGAMSAITAVVVGVIST